jgi:class 3 adenylate cyclase
MEATPPFQVVTGQRQLAAIMFTDAVGYSAQMHEQELATLNRLERDAALMRRLVSDRGGSVLKSTGDGLLIQFSSAVEAVAAALDIQREFQSRTDSGVSASTLRHRIGIHLGDVFVSEGDVMGDGVNIAARLVAEALPGGIVISEMVHALVKNKLPLHVRPLGQRHLKNIKEPVLAWRVLLEEPPVPPPVVAAADATAVSPPVAAKPGFRPQRVILTVLLILAVLAGGRFLLQEHLAHEEDLEESHSAQAAFGALAKKSAAAGETIAPVVSAPPARDFLARVSRTPAALHPTPETLPLVQAAEASVASLLAWLPGELEHYTKDRPLVVAGLGDASFQGSTIFTDANHQLYFTGGGAVRRRTWAELKEPVQAAIIVGVLRRATPPAGAELWRGAEAFAYLHGLPEMAAALAQP